MTEQQKKAIKEIQILLAGVDAVIESYDLQDEFISVIALGFLDLESSYVDEEGNTRADMSLLSSFCVSDEEELDDLLSYCVEAYDVEKKEEEPKEGTIDWWLSKFSGRGGEIN